VLVRACAKTKNNNGTAALELFQQLKKTNSTTTQQQQLVSKNDYMIRCSQLLQATTNLKPKQKALETCMTFSLGSRTTALVKVFQWEMKFFFMVLFNTLDKLDCTISQAKQVHSLMLDFAEPSTLDDLIVNTAL
jgi:hypothetical protein